MADRLWSERQQMVDRQIRRRGVQDPRVLQAMADVPRHLFVPIPAREAAYDDTPLTIGHGQTISQPYIVALMTAELRLHGTERVLEIGTGSGYQAAVLSRLAREVISVELLPGLAAHASRVLYCLGCKNVAVHIGDGSVGWPEAAPYDGIIVTAAAPSIPAALLEQLADPGRLVIPLENGNGYQLLTLLTRNMGIDSQSVLGTVAFVPLRGKYGVKGR
ncbi:MAG TPA: protein-L-isoaspartate(D-aspartate) O-methyltransferase [Anaerolineales bacterium]